MPLVCLLTLASAAESTAAERQGDTNHLRLDVRPERAVGVARMVVGLLGVCLSVRSMSLRHFVT